MRCPLLAAALVFPALCAGQQQYLIRTVAGATPPPSPETAVGALVWRPTGVTVDSSGNVYFTAGQYVFRLDRNGLLTRIAGTGQEGFAGDGGPAQNAKLSSPAGLAFDAAGNLYVADSLNARIRRVDAAGIITTVAGGGNGDPTQGSAATSAQLKYPYGLAVDAEGNLLIADSNWEKVLKLAPSGIMTTFAGGRAYPGGGTTDLGDGGPATSALMGPASGVAVDASGNVYIADGINHIRKVDTNGIITTIAGNGNAAFAGDGGPATEAQFAGPNSIALDAAGNIYFSDLYSNRVRKIATGGIVTTVAGDGAGEVSGDGGPATSAGLTPAGLGVDGQGNLFIADYYDGLIREVSTSGIITSVAGNFYLGPTLYTSAVVNGAIDPSVDSQGNRYAVDDLNDTVQKITPAGVVTTVAGNGIYCPPPAAPFFNGPSCFSGDGGPAVDAQLNGPREVAVDQAGNLFIADAGNGRIRKVSTSGIITTVAGGGSDTGDGVQALSAAIGAEGVAVDGENNLFLSSVVTVRKISSNGFISTIAGNGTSGYSGDGGLATSAELSSTGVIALDASGDVYFVDGGGTLIRELTPTTDAAVIAAIVDAATEATGPVSPGKIVVIYGSGMGPAQLATASPLNGVFDAEVGGTAVYFNGIPAPILYSSATQIAAIAPYEIAGSATAQVTVSYQNAVSPAFAVAVAASAPSFFSLNGTGAGPIAAVNADGSLNDAAHPVKTGGLVSLYANGTGATSPASADGQLAMAPYAQTALPVEVTVGGVAAGVVYAGAAPEEVAGLAQIVVQIPEGVQPGGYVPVVLKVGSASSVSGVAWIAVSAN
ncbi:MAG TPA: IPT/TIG domain-containing protein [Bryobacteraceae bacterium]|nr:IPT/TIG domain-containing protein [Bryobacteraceae bacterium]